MPASSTKAYLGTAASNGLILACGVATGIVSARLLMPEGRGLLAIILFWPQLIASIGFFSLHEATTYRAAQTKSTDTGIVLTTACWVSVIFAVCTIIVGYVLLPYLLGANRIEWISLTQVYLLLFVPGTFIALALLAIDHGQQHFVRYNVARTIPAITYLSGLIALWGWDLIEVRSVAWANLAGTVLAAFVVLVAVRKQLLTRPSWREARHLLSFGGRAHVTAVLLILSSQVDRIVVLTIWDNATVGMYAVAVTVAYSGLSVLTESLHTVMFPRLASQSDVANRKMALTLGLKHGIATITPFAALLMLLCPWLIPFLFGNMFSDAVAPTIVLLLAYVPLALRQIAARGLRGIGDTGAGTVAETITLSVFLLTAWPLGHVLGLVGIGVGLLIANTVALVYLARYLSKHVGIGYTTWLTVRAWVDLIQNMRLRFRHANSSGRR